ncbi:MAG: hypothetical protein JW900_12770 [Anaerolineae bacterium]|nr:hypothetical protein [Anaerolineae bacterium]
MGEQPFQDEWEKDDRNGNDWGEKGHEKHEKEHEKDEKSWDEKWRRDPLYTASWAVILIWAGIVLLLNNLDVLPYPERMDPWDFIFLGAGVVVLFQAIVRLLFPSYRRPVLGTLILAAVFLAIGLDGLIASGVIWAAALIVAGALLLLRGLVRR